MNKRETLAFYNQPCLPPEPPVASSDRDIPVLAELSNAHDIAIRIRGLQDDLETTLGRLERSLAGGLPDQIRREAKARAKPGVGGRGAIP